METANKKQTVRGGKRLVPKKDRPPYDPNSRPGEENKYRSPEFDKQY